MGKLYYPLLEYFFNPVNLLIASISNWSPIAYQSIYTMAMLPGSSYISYVRRKNELCLHAKFSTSSFVFNNKGLDGILLYIQRSLLSISHPWLVTYVVSLAENTHKLMRKHWNAACYASATIYLKSLLFYGWYIISVLTTYIT